MSFKSCPIISKVMHRAKSKVLLQRMQMFSINVIFNFFIFNGLANICVTCNMLTIK